MNPVPLFLIIVSLPLLLGGCGEKEESVSETKPVEEKVLEVKEKVKPEEPVAETEPKSEGVNEEEIERREGIMYLKGSDTPYTGTRIRYVNGRKEAEVNFRDGKRDGLLAFWYENGQKMRELNWKDGKRDGLLVFWYKNGQKRSEQNYKDGKRDGLLTTWHENGQKWSEENYNQGELISQKYWNSKGEPVDSIEEAEK